MNLRKKVKASASDPGPKWGVWGRSGVKSVGRQVQSLRHYLNGCNKRLCLVFQPLWSDESSFSELFPCLDLGPPFPPKAVGMGRG